MKIVDSTDHNTEEKNDPYFLKEESGILKIGIDKYKWFTIVRNPYNSIISEINFLIKSNHIKIDNVDFNRYLQYILSNLLTDENKLNIEFIALAIMRGTDGKKHGVVDL